MSCVILGMKSITWESMLKESIDVESRYEKNADADSSIEQTRSDYDCHQNCRHGIFVEPMKWMGSRNPAFINGGTSSEKIHCEKCNSKVGIFGWLNSISCPCGVLMGPPGFFIQMSRVDKCTMVKEVEASI